MNKKNILGLLPHEWKVWLEDRNEPAYRAKQIGRWIYGERVSSFQEMTDLPLVLREALATHFVIGVGRVEEKQCSQDGTKKFLLSFGNGGVEAVLIPHRTHCTLCVSSQIGCPVECQFCTSGRVGFLRNLEFQEIIEEIWLIEREEKRRINNIVFMGMGEPLLNYDELSCALRVITSPDGLGIGARHITVSTVGVPDKIVRLGREWKEVNLALSLHAPYDGLRSQLVPLNKVYPLSTLFQAVREYIALTHRRVTVAYTLWSGINDGVKEARALACLLKGMLVHVNLIPGNVVGDSSFRPSSRQQMARFAQELRGQGVEVTVRKTRGQDIEASCGELYRIWKGGET